MSMHYHMPVLGRRPSRVCIKLLTAIFCNLRPLFALFNPAGAVPRRQMH
jgi:hypothetical protein